MQHPPVGPSDALWRSEVNSLQKSLIITELSLCGWILAISTATFVCDLLEKLSTFCWYYLHPTANMVFLVLGPFQADCELNREPLSQTHTTCVVRLCGRGVHRGCRMNGRPSRGCGGWGGEMQLLSLPGCGPGTGARASSNFFQLAFLVHAKVLYELAVALGTQIRSRGGNARPP